MAKGKPEENNPKRRPKRPRPPGLSVPLNSSIRKKEKEMRGGVDISKIKSSVTEEDMDSHPYLTDEQVLNPLLDEEGEWVIDEEATETIRNY